MPQQLQQTKQVSTSRADTLTAELLQRCDCYFNLTK